MQSKSWSNLDMVKLERKVTATTLVSLTSLNKFEDAKRVIV
jgi:hypothetical protein